MIGQPTFGFFVFPAGAEKELRRLCQFHLVSLRSDCGGLVGVAQKSISFRLLITSRFKGNERTHKPSARPHALFFYWLPHGNGKWIFLFNPRGSPILRCNNLRMPRYVVLYRLAD